MKNIYKISILFLAAVIIQSCGSDFLHTDYNAGEDEEGALTNTTNIELTTIGLYRTFFDYRFAGNYVITIGDLAGDMAGYNNAAGHWETIYKYTVTENDTYLEDIWEYGYKIIDGAARVIKASDALIADPATSDEDKETLQLCIADASTLKGLATLYLTNIFGLPVKVNGSIDNGSTLGVVAIETPKEPFEKVERATVAQCYERIVADFDRAIGIFKELKMLDNEKLKYRTTNYFSEASANGLMARTLLYLEDYDNAKTYAQTALDLFGGEMIYDPEAYMAMYQTTAANSESMFKLAITTADSWSANSSGTLWSSYGYQPGNALMALIQPNDIRYFFFDGYISYSLFFSNGAKFLGEGGNPAVATHFMVRMPEMYLIIAECELRSPQGTLANAQEALLNVAKRNPDIATTADLPADETGLLAFLEDERSRELFQEGHRFYDLRRWGKQAIVTDGINGPFDIFNFQFPIPDAEVRTGFGVVQTENWFLNLP